MHKFILERTVRNERNTVGYYLKTPQKRTFSQKFYTQKELLRCPDSVGRYRGKNGVKRIYCYTKGPRRSNAYYSATGRAHIIPIDNEQKNKRSHATNFIFSQVFYSTPATFSTWNRLPKRNLSSNPISEFETKSRRCCGSKISAVLPEREESRRYFVYSDINQKHAHPEKDNLSCGYPESDFYFFHTAIKTNNTSDETLPVPIQFSVFVSVKNFNWTDKIPGFLREPHQFSIGDFYFQASLENSNTTLTCNYTVRQDGISDRISTIKSSIFCPTVSYTFSPDVALYSFSIFSITSTYSIQTDVRSLSEEYGYRYVSSEFTEPVPRIEKKKTDDRFFSVTDKKSPFRMAAPAAEDPIK